MGLNLVNLAVSIRSDNCFKLASVLLRAGGAFSTVCRRLCCDSSERGCVCCSKRASCSWLSLFGQELTCDPAALKRHQKPPLPFMFTFPMPVTERSAEDILLCELVVFGSAIAHTSLLLQGLAELLSNATWQPAAEIVSVACRDYQGTLQDSASATARLLPEELVIMSMEGLLESRIWSTTEICLACVSPLRLMQDGHITSRFEFGCFARSVMRRVSSLSYYYGENELDWDFKELSRLIDDVICAEDGFRFMKHPQNQLSGIIGTGCFIGDFTRIHPFLVIGTFAHTGKGATFGMGAYEIISMP